MEDTPRGGPFGDNAISKYVILICAGSVAALWLIALIFGRGYVL